MLAVTTSTSRSTSRGYVRQVPPYAVETGTWPGEACGREPQESIPRDHPKPRDPWLRDRMGMGNITRVKAAPPPWAASTTVASERRRLSGRLSASRNVFGMYGETTQPHIARMSQDLAELEGQPDNATLIPVPHGFAVTHASQLLPRGARVVGWLDDHGYRGVADTPQPSPDWLESQAALLSASTSAALPAAAASSNARVGACAS